MGKSLSNCKRLLCAVSIASCPLLMGPWALLATAGDEISHIQLDCKISPSAGGANWWEVELRRPSGELVGQATAMNGDAARFKNLRPGIYNLCILGTENRERCESVDLNPPPNKRSFRFSRYLRAPEHLLNLKGLNMVNQTSLAVPAHARDELYRAEQSEVRGDTKQMVGHLRKAIEIDPNYADALNNLGTYYHRVGKHEESVQYFKKVTELEPEFYGGWVNLGGSLLSLGRFQEALAANSKAYELRPNDGVVLAQTALSYYYLHDLTEARQLFTRLKTIDPASPVEPELFLTHIALAERNKEEAKEHIGEFLKIHPNAPEAARMRDLLNNLDNISFSEPDVVAQSKR